MGKYGFAKKWLAHKGNKIFINDLQILKDDCNCPYEVSPLKTEIIKGNDIIVNEEDFIHISYHQLNLMGFGVAQEAVSRDDKRFKAQRFTYTIKKRTSTTITLHELLKGMVIQYDQKNERVRVVGKLCGSSTTRPDVGNWVNVKKDSPKKTMTPEMYGEVMMNGGLDMDPVSNLLIETIGQRFDYKKKIEIKEVPFMISNENEIICIDKKPDMQKIGVVGDTGTGKSLMSVRLLTHIFYKWSGDWVCVLNDTMSQFHEMSRPAQTKEFVSTLKLIGEKPVCLPVVNLFVSSPNVKLFNEKEGVSFYYVMDSLELYSNFQKLTEGMDGCDLGNPVRYMQTLKKDLAKITHKDEVNTIMEAGIPNSQKDGMQSMIFRWKNAIGNILYWKFLNVSYPDNPMVSSKWRVQTKYGSYTGDPLICSMKAGLLPVINTHSAKSYPHLRNFLAKSIEEVIKYQEINRYESKERIWMIADEVGDLYRKGMNKKMDNLGEVMVRIFTQGRFQKIGFIYNIQSLGNVHQDLIKEANILISFRISTSEKERTLIKKTFGLSTEETRQLSELDKDKKECIAISSDNFIVYDRDGNRKPGRRFYRGYLIPPNVNTVRLSDEVSV